MCHGYIAYGPCGCVKQTIGDCGNYIYRRLVGGAQPDEPRWSCPDFEIVETPWLEDHKCTVDHDARSRRTLEQFDWTAEFGMGAENVDSDLLELLDFNWDEDWDVLTAKACYEAEQAVEFEKLVEADPYAKALLEGIDPKAFMVGQSD